MPFDDPDMQIAGNSALNCHCASNTTREMPCKIYARVKLTETMVVHSFEILSTGFTTPSKGSRKNEQPSNRSKGQ